MWNRQHLTIAPVAFRSFAILGIEGVKVPVTNTVPVIEIQMSTRWHTLYK